MDDVFGKSFNYWESWREIGGGREIGGEIFQTNRAGEAARLHYGPTARASSKSFSFPGKTIVVVWSTVNFPGKTREATQPPSKDASLEDSTSKPGLPVQMVKMSMSTSEKHSLTGHISFPRDEEVERSSSRQMLVPGSRQMEDWSEPEVQRHGAMLLTPVWGRQIYLSNSWGNTLVNSFVVQKHGEGGTKMTCFQLFSCPEQLNRWPCHSLTESLTHSRYFYFRH